MIRLTRIIWYVHWRAVGFLLAADGFNQGTIGIDFISQVVKTTHGSVRLQIWDTAGQERFKSLVPSYIRGSKAVLLVYDVANSASFEDVKMWHAVVADEGYEPV